MPDSKNVRLLIVSIFFLFAGEFAFAQNDVGEIRWQFDTEG